MLLNGLSMRWRGEVSWLSGSDARESAVVVVRAWGYVVTVVKSNRRTGHFEMEPEERAVAGLFLAFQYPVEIPGVGNMTFMRTALNALRKARGLPERSAAEFLRLVRSKAKQLHVSPDMLKRPVNYGFSGGEKKRNEILQMAILDPRLCILDEQFQVLTDAYARSTQASLSLGTGALDTVIERLPASLN